MDEMICLEHTSKLAKVGMVGNGYAVRESDETRFVMCLQLLRL